MVTRSARCCCGGLRAETTGEPTFVLACHCIECQRRTGAVFGVGAYFDRAQVRVDGTSSVYARERQAGRLLRFHFCPMCGTTVHWDLDAFPDKIGVAIGAFADAAFPASNRSSIRASMTGVAGLRSQHSLNFPGGLALDPMTVSFWEGDAAARAFAYGGGVHKMQMDRSRGRQRDERGSKFIHVGTHVYSCAYASLREVPASVPVRWPWLCTSRAVRNSRPPPGARCA